MLVSVLFFATILSCQKQEIEYPASRNNVSGLITNSTSNLIYEETFEGTAPFSTYVSKQIGTSYGFTVATSPVFHGNRSGRFELRDTDPLTNSGTRAEIKFPMLENINRWYSFSVYFPSADYKYDSKAEIINQWHQGGGVSPSISLITRYNKLVVERRSEPGTKTQYPLGDLVKDKWQTYVLHIIHSHGSDGLIEVWKDGVKIFTHSGANSYDMNIYERPKWKIGLYKWDWNGSETTDVSKRVLYFDNVRLGNERASLSDMISTGTVISPDPIVTPAPISAPVDSSSSTSAMSIKNFTIINSGTERDVITIVEGGTYSLAKLGITKMNIRANPSTTFGSVKFNLSGPQNKVSVDDASPYSVMGDDGNGNYYFGIWGPPIAGNYTLKAVPYSAAKATGTVGTSSTINFTVTN